MLSRMNPKERKQFARLFTNRLQRSFYKHNLKGKDLVEMRNSNDISVTT